MKMKTREGVCILAISLLFLAPEALSVEATSTLNHTLMKEMATTVMEARWAWSSWGPWGPCSRTCGGGVALQTRICLPSNSTRVRRSRPKRKTSRRRERSAVKQRGCLGLARRYHECNTAPCPGPVVDSREEQCSAFDKRPFRGHFYTWVPYIDGNAPCVLNCRPRGQQFYASLSLAADGTPCTRPHYRAICLQGLCKVVGKEAVLSSVAGPSTPLSCGDLLVSGLFTRSKLPLGYTLVATVPKGACYLKVTEMKPSENYLALRVTNGSYVINGGFAVSAPGYYEAAGTRFEYRRGRDNEYIANSGSVLAPVDIMVLYQKPDVAIKYEYYIQGDNEEGNALSQKKEEIRPPKRHPRRHRGRFFWKITWGACSSRTCGGGTQVGAWRCTDEEGVETSPALCPGPPPPAKRRRCGSKPCAPRWKTAAWGKCPVCGPAARTRTVGCVQDQATGIVKVSDRLCAGPKPATSEPCRVPLCNREKQGRGDIDAIHDDPRTVVVLTRIPPKTDTDELSEGWLASEWSECVGSCLGGGIKTRLIRCTDEQKCGLSREPKEMAPCRSNRSCSGNGEWLTGEWSPCTRPPGCGGSQTRVVMCISSNGRRANSCTSPKPLTNRACPVSLHSNCRPSWFVGSWSPCTGDCQDAKQTRVVQCLSSSGVSEACEKSKPGDSRKCILDNCQGENELPTLAHHQVLPTTALPLKEAVRTTRNDEENTIDMTEKPMKDEQRDEPCEDKLANCALAVQARLCHYRYYLQHCCNSCHGR